MTEEEFKVVENMSTYGGSFVKALAECFHRADRKNFFKLRFTFSDYGKSMKIGNNMSKFKGGEIVIPPLTISLEEKISFRRIGLEQFKKLFGSKRKVLKKGGVRKRFRLFCLKHKTIPLKDGIDVNVSSEEL